MLGQIFSYLWTERRVIREAPFAFAICALLSAGLFGLLAWWVVDIRYSDRLYTLRERLELERDRNSAQLDASAAGALEIGIAMPGPGSPHFVLRNTGDKPIRYAVEEMLVIENEKAIPHSLKEVGGRIAAGGKKDVWTEPRLTFLEGAGEYYIDLHVSVRYGLEDAPYTQLSRNRRLCRIRPDGRGACKVLFEKDYTIASDGD